MRTIPLQIPMRNSDPDILRFAVRRRFAWRSTFLVCALVAACQVSQIRAATVETANFVVTAPTADAARQVATAAEACRTRFAREWMAVELPDWKRPCRVNVNLQPTGGSGSTVYDIYRGRAERPRITLSGPLDRILDYVLPHEVTHAVLALWLGQPPPRWADEGVALLCETESQRSRQRRLAEQMFNSSSLMALDKVVTLVDYPEDRKELVGFYVASFSFTEFLVAQGGKARLMEFLKDLPQAGWDRALTAHYEFASSSGLEDAWQDWLVRDGSGRVGLAQSSQPVGE